MDLPQNILNNPWILPLLIVWTVPWKAVGLWKAANNGHKKWFGAILLLNTLGILEMAYVFFFSGKKTKKHES